MQLFTNSTLYKNDDVYDIVTDAFHTMKKYGFVEEWCEVEDLYVDNNDTVYCVQHYYDSYFEVEGHGRHTITESEPDMRSAVKVITQGEILAALHPEVFYKV